MFCASCFHLVFFFFNFFGFVCLGWVFFFFCMCWGFFLFIFYTDIEDALCFLAVYNSFKRSVTILPVTSRVLLRGGGLSVGPGSDRVRYTSLPLFHAALPHCYNHCLAEQRLQ